MNKIKQRKEKEWGKKKKNKLCKGKRRLFIHVGKEMREGNGWGRGRGRKMERKWGGKGEVSWGRGRSQREG